MPDTKDGRESNGQNKRRQRIEQLTERELETLEEEGELPSFDDADGPFLAEELPEDRS